MSNIKRSVKRKALISVIVNVSVMLLIIFSLLFYLMYYQLKERYREDLTSMAQSAAEKIDAGEHEKIRTVADENSSDYLKIKQFLQNFKKANPEIKYIYTMRKTDPKDIWEFVVDAQDKNSWDFSNVGDKYDVSNYNEMKRALDEPIADKQFKLDAWGLLLSGYAPIKDTFGKSVAIVGIDIAASTILSREKQIIGDYIFIFIGIMILAIIITQKSTNRFLKPINQIIQGVMELQKGNSSYRLNIETGDEIEEIANVINKTADVVVQYQNVLEENLRLEKEQSSKIFNAYKDVIYSITQGRFRLLNIEEIQTIDSEGTLCCEMSLKEPSEVEKARLLVSKFIKKDELTSLNEMHVILCVSEAATNVIKYAKYGKMQIRRFKDKMRIIFKDNGSGMDFERLPKMIFLKGFSTEFSMGCGFSIINKFASQIYLATSKEGTFLALDFDSSEADVNVKLEAKCEGI